ncbi:unnamed protein product, partial [Discosporangium mesarthrocarpum]
DQKHVYLVLDRLSGGSLKDMVTQQGKLEESHAAHVMDQVVSAVRYCHKIGIA